MKEHIVAKAWKRNDGRKGIRNKVLIIYTVECSRHAAVAVAQYFQEKQEDVDVTGSLACLDNQVVIRRLLKYSIHQNVGAVLVIGHGCEYIRPEKLVSFAKEHGRIAAYLYLQEDGGTQAVIEKGKRIVQRMLEELQHVPQCDLYASELIIGAKCGGSDFTSGIAGNALVGEFFDRFVEEGGTAMIEEMGEAVGLKDYLVSRAADEQAARDISMTYDKTVEFCRRLGRFSISPGNFTGGLTTIEEKSMGAVVKSGSSPIKGILKIAQSPPRKGFWMLDVIPDYKLEPGFYQGGDTSGLMDQIASDCHLLLFVSGRGHVGGTPIAPVIKITGNPETYQKMKQDIDIDASGILTQQENMETLLLRLEETIGKVCCGEKTCAERNGHREGTLFFNYQHPNKVIPFCYS